MRGAFAASGSALVCFLRNQESQYLSRYRFLFGPNQALLCIDRLLLRSNTCWTMMHYGLIYEVVLDLGTVHVLDDAIVAVLIAACSTEEINSY